MNRTTIARRRGVGGPGSNPAGQDGEFPPSASLLTTSWGAISTLWDAPRRALRAIVFLAHGAGSRVDHPTMTALAEALVLRGFGVLRFNYPYTEAGRSRPDPESILIETWLEVFGRALPAGAFPGVPRLAAGRSLGGRMASLAAARHPGEFRPAGLVLFAYPLHPPGRPDRLRTEHLAGIALPVLFLSGTRDEFAGVELMERAIGVLPDATLRWLEGADHSFHVLKRSGRRDEEVLAEAMNAMERWILRSGILPLDTERTHPPGKGISQ